MRADERCVTTASGDTKKRARPMGAFDDINGRFGKWTAVTASQGFRLRSGMRSPAWTTSINEVPTVRAGQGDTKRGRRPFDQRPVEVGGHKPVESRPERIDRQPASGIGATRQRRSWNRIFRADQTDLLPKSRQVFPSLSLRPFGDDGDRRDPRPYNVHLASNSCLPGDCRRPTNPLHAASFNWPKAA